MAIPSAWEEIEADDLPHMDLQWLAHKYGVAMAVDFWRRCAGTSIDFPVRMPKQYAIRFIRKHFDGHNVPQLARALGMSARTVQEYIGARPEGRKRVPDPAQLSLI